MLANEFMNLEVLVNGVRAMQMSTSRNLAVWLHEALDDFPADLLRFYLASILPETNDVNFSWREFQERVNSDLIGNLGNYINRTSPPLERYFDGEVTSPEEPSESARAALAEGLEQRYEARMRAGRPRDALGELLAMGRRTNRFFDSEAPGRAAKKIRNRLGRRSIPARSCSVPSLHAAPFVPEAVERLGGFFSGPMVRVSDLKALPDAYRAKTPNRCSGESRTRRSKRPRKALRRS